MSEILCVLWIGFIVYGFYIAGKGRRKGGGGDPPEGFGSMGPLA